MKSARFGINESGTVKYNIHNTSYILSILMGVGGAPCIETELLDFMREYGNQFVVANGRTHSTVYFPNFRTRDPNS